VGQTPNPAINPSLLFTLGRSVPSTATIQRSRCRATNALSNEAVSPIEAKVEAILRTKMTLSPTRVTMHFVRSIN